MTRKKKTRKGGPLALAKPQQPAFGAPPKPTTKSKQAKKGKPPGNRHSAAKLVNQPAASQLGSSDPRHGSTRKITLVAPKATLASTATPAATSAPAAELDYAALAAELHRLQDDQRLQQLLDLLEQGEPISADDADYVDACTERFAELADILELDVDDEDE